MQFLLNRSQSLSSNKPRKAISPEHVLAVDSLRGEVVLVNLGRELYDSGRRDLFILSLDVSVQLIALRLWKLVLSWRRRRVRCLLTMKRHYLNVIRMSLDVLTISFCLRWGLWCPNFGLCVMASYNLQTKWTSF